MTHEKSQSLEEYREHFDTLAKKHGDDTIYSQAVGGEFSAIGKLEKDLLISLGLKEDHAVIDVGCGSGRLAFQLAPYRGMSYLGCDVVPELLEHAASLCKRPDWRFEHTNGIGIPAGDASADFVCFFSVFTHLTHEETFKYFLEARRTLRRGGIMVMSFLEFRIPSHWHQFRVSVEDIRPDKHLNQFVSRDGIAAWAKHAGLGLLKIFDGDENYIPLTSDVRFENGGIVSGTGTLGQSVAILKNTGDDPFEGVIVDAIEPENHAYIDSPKEDGEASSKGVIVHGWIWFPKLKEEIRSVQIVADGRLVGETDVLYERSDVSTVLGIPQTERTGFTIPVSDLGVARGESATLGLALSLKNGVQYRTKTKRRFRIVA
ncbi:MAG: methyltransferase domain-containing protein [Opitutaceae bacterium]|nr:methyltransferase domain-containing protein [Opitutaceae bacterium]